MTLIHPTAKVSEQVNRNCPVDRLSAPSVQTDRHTDDSVPDTCTHAFGTFLAFHETLHLLLLSSFWNTVAIVSFCTLSHTVL